MGFHNVRFPMRLALGASGGPEWRSEIVTLASGREIRNALWARGRRQWRIESTFVDLADVQELITFFEARGGRLNGFRFRDPLDHSSAPPGQIIGLQDQLIGIGDDETVEFQLTKTTGGLLRNITKPVAETAMVALDAAALTTGWSLDCETGLVTFETAPALSSKITAGFEFDVPVRFDVDRIEAVIETVGAGRLAKFGVIEILDPSS